MTDKPEQPSLAALDLAALKVVMLRELNDTGATYRQCLDLLESQAARIAELEGAIRHALAHLADKPGGCEIDGATSALDAALTPKVNT